MFLTGLSLSTLLGIGAAVGGLTVLLYVLRLRRRPVAVPFARIWISVLRDREATRLFSRLKRILSLLLQLAMVALLVLALGDPRLSIARDSARNIVVLVDTSASMTATDVLPSRLDVAKEKVRELFLGMGANDRMLIAGMDVSVTPLSTLTAEVPELEGALEGLKATDTAADLGRALRFARDALRAAENPEVILVSDGALADVAWQKEGQALGDVKFGYLAVGSGGKNVAITQFSVRRYPLDKARAEVLLELSNMTDQPIDVELTLTGDGEVIDVSRLRLGPRERLPRFFQDLAGAGHTLEAQLRLAGGGEDDFSRDDHAYALVPEKRRARVLLVSAGNTYLEAALLLDEYLEVKSVLPQEPAPEGGFDVAIYDSVEAAFEESAAAHVYLNPPANGSPVRRAREIQMFGFDTWDKKSPLLRFAAMENVQVLRGFALVPEVGDKVLGASNQGPILVSGRRKGKPFVVLGFDPRQSDFVLRIAWPLFVLNTINSLTEEEAGYVSAYRTGEVWRIPAPSVPSGRLTTPGGGVERVSVEDGRAVYRGTRAGFYKLSFETGAETSVIEFAANLSNYDESRIQAVPDLKLGAEPPSPITGFEVRAKKEIWVYLLIAVVLASFLEWFSYHRRWTV